MEYRIEQYTDDIFVYLDNTEFLVVKRKFNYLGKLFSKFYRNGELILETTYDIFLFQKFISIVYQNLPISISLQKSRGEYLVIRNNKKLRVRRRYFRNPLYFLLEDNIIVGEISTKLTGIAVTPKVFNLNFYSDTESNFNLLLLFLIALSPTMDA